MAILVKLTPTDMESKARPTTSQAKSGRRPMSIMSIAVIVLCSAIGGGHIGYYIGINAAKPQQAHVIQNEAECVCDEVNEDRADSQQLTVDEKKEPCPVVICDEVKKEQEPCPIVTCDGGNEEKNPSSTGNENKPRFPESMEKLAVGMSRVSRDEFAKKFDTGVPLQKTEQGNEQVLILYSHVDALPISPEEAQAQGDVPLTSVGNATANCDFLNVILTNVHFKNKQCVALMGQSESSHIQRWMRLPAIGSEVNSTEPLRFVGRVSQELGGGSASETAPFSTDTQNHWDFLRKYTADLESILEELRPLAEKAAKNNTLIVMFSNFGQSELIVNFCCSARNRNLDLSPVLFFATDFQTKELVEGLGMTVFYNEAVFGSLPSGAAQYYGDRTFSHMMKAKVICLHLASLLGYDILFQDADVVWYRDPIPYFHNEELATFDVLIADDGNQSPA